MYDIYAETQGDWLVPNIVITKLLHQYFEIAVYVYTYIYVNILPTIANRLHIFPTPVQTQPLYVYEMINSNVGLC